MKLKGSNGDHMEVSMGKVSYSGKGGGKKPVKGVTARVESGAELESRVTATRLVLLGVFAFAAKKKTGGEKFVTIEGPDFVWAMEVDRKHANDAVEFAAAVNNAARK